MVVGARWAAGLIASETAADLLRFSQSEVRKGQQVVDNRKVTGIQK